MGAIRRGKLLSGREWVVTPSAKKAVPEGQGDHLIFHFVGDPPRDQVNMEDQTEGIGVAWSLMDELTPGAASPGYWRMEGNGPKAASWDQFHLHLIFWNEGFKVRHCVDSIAA